MSDKYDLAYKNVDELSELPARSSAAVPVYKDGQFYQTFYNRVDKRLCYFK